MGEPLLRVSGLNTYYDDSHILRGASLELARGETLGLMGRNGMGKTTLIRTVMGLVKPRSGSILFDGHDITGKQAFRISRLGVAYVPEGRGIFDSLSVAENLAIVDRRESPDRHWTLSRVLDLFPRLKQRYANRGNQLSGGEQQMLAIGRALLTNPRLLILDEATEGLAPIIRDDIWRTIRLVRDSGIATLLVDKSVSEVSAVADRIVILVKGQVAFEGTPAALTERPEIMYQHLGV
ncbi:MAG: ABC transporter ATP-binding protein [Hyphomicrobiaceae bacterium]|nr:MAG: ABC transporter ATP-binding protein [Hyphomicrobiaceae bacterium]